METNKKERKIFNVKRYNIIAIYVISVALILLLMILTIFKFSEISDLIRRVLKILSPIIWGVIIAIILNPFVKIFEKILLKILPKLKLNKKFARIFSVLFSALIFSAILCAIIAIIIPQIIKSLIDITDALPSVLKKMSEWGDRFLKENDELLKYFNDKITDINQYLQMLIQRAQPIIQDAVSDFFKLITGIFNFFVGIIVSIYLLISKDSLLAQSKKTCLALFNGNYCEKIFTISRKSLETFLGVITGKLLDSFLVGIIAFFGLFILNVPYALIISVLVGVTNIIPFFGPFIGAIPSGFLILLSEPKKLISFIIFIVVLQQIEGNLIEPRIIGDSTGLPSFWVLFSILLGGGLFGIVGMLLGVPIFSVLYSIFKTMIEEKLKEKSLPVSTKEYMQQT